MTLERRVGVWYLSLLLTGETSPELGDDRRVSRVAFQQAPYVAVDDVVLHATRPGESAPSLRLAIGVRRRPNFVRSDQDTSKLVVEYVRALLREPEDGLDYRLGLAVAGDQTHTRQLAQLAVLARMQSTESEFFELLAVPRRFDRGLSDRLSHLVDMIEAAHVELGTLKPDTDLVRRTTWQLLSVLEVLHFRLEEPDTADWATIQNRLVGVARGRDLTGAGRLRDALQGQVAVYAPHAASVDESSLRRDMYALLETAAHRYERAWALLDELDRLARGSVRNAIGTAASALTLDRRNASASLVAAADRVDALVVSGDSGVGKSALVFDAMAGLTSGAPEDAQAVVLNLRQLPDDWMLLADRLGAPLADAFGDLTAPTRYVVVDAADAAAETKRDVFAYLVNAAKDSRIRLIAIVQNDARQVVHDLLADRLGATAVGAHEINELEDDELEQVLHAFPALERVARAPRARALLRRLVVIDLLVRSGATEVPLSDAEAMREVWNGLVRRREQRDRGLPDAREQVLMGLASHALNGGSVSGLDPEALAGLRADGLLRGVQDNPWHVLPEFAHDEIRRYAVARVLLSAGDIGVAVIAANAPRWALSAVTLAVQASMSVYQTSTSGRADLETVQRQMDSVADAGFGARWSDVPSEAVLGLGQPIELLRRAWPTLRADSNAGLHRLLRVLYQRHRAQSLLDPLVTEPIVELLLTESAPWLISEEVATMVADWMMSLVVGDAPEGHPLRVRLRDHLAAYCDGAQVRLEAWQAEQSARASRSADDTDDVTPPPPTVLGPARRARIDRRWAVPQEIRDQTTVHLWACLGPDLGEPGEQVLRRLAQDAPEDLAPALEEPGAGRAVGSYRHGLLAVLVEAYYIVEPDEDHALLEDGIRRHTFGGVGVPLAAWYRGPFSAMFQTDLIRGIGVLNRMLNHAARVRARTLAALGDPWRRPQQEEVDRYGLDLNLTGQERRYVGDPHVWQWYRGTGVGPYPCMSALQALERVCDQLLAMDIRPERLVELLLDGCDSLAMPALAVGVLVRHIEGVNDLLDRFLAEPYVWHLEFARVTNETAGLAASSEGIANPTRRHWSLRDAAMWLTVSADDERAEQLREIGRQLVARAADQFGDEASEADAGASDDLAFVRAWASTLDRESYSAQEHADGVLLQSSPPQDVIDALEADNADLGRGSEAIRIQMRYLRALSLRQPDPPLDGRRTRSGSGHSPRSRGKPASTFGDRGRWDGWSSFGIRAARSTHRQDRTRRAGAPVRRRQPPSHRRRGASGQRDGR